ncbi:hypothetical protein [Streptomyces acidiscabies]|uniref:Uncharacterized protein n=3 Tax=Streptomyces acidiscabies TaxID=42234 RepID=A0AAP6B4G5_9ACTN|nr:hypothetical protein [Streptomyces acidiscabies]MBZ3912640.1 hypothetical protein [Streptomyces acidiscabies]MDX2958122.1 hypothetical protein [Streptomyces acidiscabies]MDX3018489.1 hypothetical protein [Streptomyces acidiscabies]MDX3796263.1 hypothetical protein [Streptomyces acidiscabies]
MSNNVLIGAALHGTDRLRAGQVPTDLERLLLDVLRTVLSEEEIRDWVRAHRETVAERPVTAGYGFADLRACARELAEEAVARPNVSFLSTEALAEGAPLWSAEFAAGVRESGFGVIGFAGVSHGSGTGDGAEPGAFRATWHLDHGPSSRVLFDGPVTDRVSFGTGTEPHDDLTRACNAAVADLDTGPPGQIFVGIAWEILKLSVSLRPHRDKTPLRFVLGRADTTVLFHRRTLELTRESDGTALRLRYGGERPPFPSGALEYATYRATERPSPWSAPVPLALRSVTAPSLVSYRGDLHAVFARPGDQRLMWSRLRDGTWSAPVPIGGSGSRQRAALTVHGDRLYSFHTTPDGRVLWNRFDGSAWTREARMDGWDSPVSPDVASHGGHLWVARRDHDKRMHLDRLDTDLGSDYTHCFADSASDSAPALVSTGDALWLAHRGLDDKVHVRYSDAPSDPAGWRTHAPAHDLLTERSPTLVDHPGLGLHLLARDTDGRLRLGARADGGGWAEPAAPAHDGGFPALDAGGAAFHDGRLYVMYRR